VVLNHEELFRGVLVGPVTERAYKEAYAKLIQIDVEQHADGQEGQAATAKTFAKVPLGSGPRGASGAHLSKLAFEKSLEPKMGKGLIH